MYVIEYAYLNYMESSHGSSPSFLILPVCNSQGHCVHFKKTYIQVAKEAYERYSKDDVEFYAISCAAVEDLCSKHSIEAYPSLYAIPAGEAMFSNRRMLGNSAFSLKDVASILNYNSGVPINTKQHRGVNELKENDESQADDGETVSDAKKENDDFGKKQDGDNDEEQDGEKRDTGSDNDENQNDDKTNEENAEGNDGEERSEGQNSKNDDNQRQGSGKPDANEDDGFDKEFEKFKRSGRNAESIPMIASSEYAGADRAKSRPKTMDQWKEIIKQQLEQLKLKRAKHGSFGRADNATSAMLANRKGTKEYWQRQKDLLATIERLKKYGRRKQRENPQEIENQLLEGQLPFKKRVAAMRVVEYVPIIKHAVRMSHEEELILDASQSFLAGLRNGVYRSNDPLPPKQRQALKDWLDLLHISLPPEWALQEAIGDLIINFKEISTSRKALRETLNKHLLLRHKWSRSCGTGNGFSCGFWKLLHTMTVGIAEYRGGQDLIASGSVVPATRTFSPSDAADTVREYMAYFFPCTECSNHFVGQYDQCELNRRCDRLTTDPSMSSDADWKELAMWLWEVHNDVNIRLLNEKHETKRWRRRKSLPEIDQVKAIWPAIPDCSVCLNEDGSFDEDSIFLHLEQTYW